MWVPTVSLYLLIFYGYTSSQPVTEDSENARQTRQLDFGECCPCPGVGQDFDAQETSMLRAAPDQDDCPCRPKNADNEGASSIFFPTSVRSDGSSIRHADKKEELKPLLHPEVDLASSVLQTLREATDEEYREALARDAARSMARAAEETLFGDAVPEATNGNVVTILVKPKQTNSFDDIIPQKSRNHESRCIHAPLESTRTILGQMRVAKKPNLLRQTFGLPKISKPAGLLHRNALDMDSGMWASNVQELIVPMDGNTNSIGKSTNILSNREEHDSLIKGGNFKLPTMKNRLKDFISNRSTLEAQTKAKNNLSPLPPIPKLKLNNNSLSKARGMNNEDLSLSPSNIEEQAKLSLLKAKSHLESIFQKPKPDGFKNLLKLKDVEFVPLKDLFNKPSDKSLPFPSILKKSGKMILTDEDENLERSQITGLTSNDETLDHDVSPSNIVEKTSDTNCINDSFKTADSEDGRIKNLNDKITSTEDMTSNFEVTTPGLDIGRDTQTNEFIDNADDCNTRTIPVTELNLPKSMENVIDDETQNTSGDELNFDVSQEQIPESATNEESEKADLISNDDNNCISKLKDADSSTDSSNNINTFIKPDDTNKENFDSELNNDELAKESCSQERQATFETSNTTPSEDSPSKNLIKPLSLDQTLSTIKENIIKTIESLKVPKPNPKNANIFNLPLIPSTNSENRESSPTADEKANPDFTNEESIPVTTTKPTDDSCVDNLENNNESTEKVSMQDLQKISDEMLQREEEQQKSKTLDCKEPSQEVTDANVDEDPTMTANQSEIDNMDAEPSANTQNEVVTDPQNLVEIGDNMANSKENTCVSELMLPKQASDQNKDANAEASEITDIITSPFSLGNVFEPKTDVLDLLKNPIPEIQDGLKLPPLPTLDEIKDKLTDLFDNTPREAEECSVSPTQAEPTTDPLSILTPVMQTDASTSNFKLRKSPITLEDLNLDILQLSPQQSLLPKLPKLDLPSHKTKLQLPELGLKPIKLEDLKLGRNNLWPNIPDNQWEIVPDLKNIGNRVKTNTQKITKSRKPETIRNSLSTKPRIGDFSDDIHSQAKNTLRSMHRSLESKFREATKPVKLQPDYLLETITRNHEDMSDKLKALHIDFNDRIETMRNNLFDKSRFANSGSRGKTFTTFSTQAKDKPFSLKATQPKSQTGRREPKKPLKTNRLDQPRSSGVGSSQRLSNQKNFKMPGAASVPVPRTIEVPKLKASLTKLPGPAVQRTSDVISGTRNMAPLDKEPSATLWKQTSRKLYNTNSRLGKQINPFKDSKINISFSTTPRPMIPARLASRKSSSRSDFKGSPSEINKSVISAPTSRQLKNFDTQNMDKAPTKLVNGRDNLKANVPSLSKNIQSWPKASESAFLSKVKEAVKARMSKVNSPDRIKQANTESSTNVLLTSNTDMTRSASENVDTIEGKALKENVSYKCTMLCTKE